MVIDFKKADLSIELLMSCDSLLDGADALIIVSALLYDIEGFYELLLSILDPKPYSLF